MQTLILPGYSEHNKNWVDDVAKNLKSVHIIRPFYWMHWTDSTSKFNSSEKAELIIKHIKEDKINIIAKSIGTLVASKIINQISNKIEKIIFCGIPLTSLSEDDLNIIKSAIQIIDNKFIGFQNISDPHGSFDEVKSHLGSGIILPKDRSDHEYPYFDEFNKFLTS